MRIERIQSAQFTATFGGAGLLELSGRTQRLVLILSGGGTADAAALTAQSVKAVVARTGTAHVTATRALEATVAGTGTIVCAGAPRTVRTHVSGTGSIAKS
jgi:Putative auto-transporter adhesin, head GIN domain